MGQMLPLGDCEAEASSGLPIQKHDVRAGCGAASHTLAGGCCCHPFRPPLSSRPRAERLLCLTSWHPAAAPLSLLLSLPLRRRRRLAHTTLGLLFVFPDLRDALLGIVKTEGLGRLYSGWGAVLLRNVPQSAAKFYLFEQVPC